MDIAIYTIIGLIIAVCIRYTVVYSIQINDVYTKLINTIKNITTNIVNDENEDKKEILNNIHNYVKGDSVSSLVSSNEISPLLLQNAWENYRAKLRKSDTGYFSLVDAREFFNRDYLLNSALKKRDFIKTIPNILTSLGLAGTFIAILLGLIKINPGDMDTIKTLIMGLGGKFSSSIVALFCSILFIRNERQKYSQLNDVCIELQNKLNLVFPVRTTNEILSNILNTISSQSETMNKTMSSIEEKSLSGVHEMVVKMETALQGFEKQSFNGLSRMVNEMVDKFEKAVSEQTVNKFNNVFEKVEQSFNQLTGIIDEIQGAQEDYLENMETLRSTSEVALENQKCVVETIKASLSTIQNEISKFTNLVNTNNECMEKMFNITGELAYAGDQFNSAVPTLIETNNSINELSKSLNASIQHFKEISETVSIGKFQPIMETFKSDVSNLLSDIQNTLGTVFIDAQNYFDDVPNMMAKIIQEQIHKIEQAMGNYSESTNSFLTSYDEHMHTAVNMLQTNINETQNAFESNISTLNKNFNKLSETLQVINNNLNGEQ